MLPLLLPLITHVIANIIQLVHAVLFHFVRPKLLGGLRQQMRTLQWDSWDCCGVVSRVFFFFFFFFKKKKRASGKLVTLFFFACISSFGFSRKGKRCTSCWPLFKRQLRTLRWMSRTLVWASRVCFPAQRSLLEVRSWFFGLSKQRRSQRRRLV